LQTPAGENWIRTVGSNDGPWALSWRLRGFLPTTGPNARVIKLSAVAICATASSCNVAMEVGIPSRWASTDPNVNLSPAPSQRYVQVIDIMHTHLGAGAAMVQPFFFCASDHSTEPGWGTDCTGCGLLRSASASTCRRRSS
jgi:hypothetical protein